MEVYVVSKNVDTGSGLWESEILFIASSLDIGMEYIKEIEGRIKFATIIEEDCWEVNPSYGEYFQIEKIFVDERYDVWENNIQ